MIRKFAISMVVAGMFACAGMAQDKPDFSGTWNLNVTKSDFGPVPGPNSETLVITEDGTKVKETILADTDQGKESYELAYTTDGTEIVYPADSAPHVGIVTLQKLKASWKGSSLVLTEVLKYQEDGDVTGTISRALSPDGKILTLDFDLMTPIGAVARKYVFDRAGAGSAMSSMAAPTSSASPAAMTAPAAASSSTAAPMASASIGATPNLSGTWKLNIAKSDFGPAPPPDSRVDTIEDNEPSIKITSVRTGGAMGSGTIMTEIFTDGRESTSKIFGNDAKTMAHWDSGALTTNVKTTMQGSDATFKNVYTLSADGKTLTIASHVSMSMGEFDLKFLFDKQ
jgi:hypothetical protein